MESSHHLLTSVSVAKSGTTKNSENYIVKRKLFSDTSAETQNRVLSLSCKTISRTERDEQLLQELSSKYHTCMKTTGRKAKRILPSVPETVLDAPNLIDDFCKLVAFFPLLLPEYPAKSSGSKISIIFFLIRILERELFVCGVFWRDK